MGAAVIVAIIAIFVPPPLNRFALWIGPALYAVGAANLVSVWLREQRLRPDASDGVDRRN